MKNSTLFAAGERPIIRTSRMHSIRRGLCVCVCVCLCVCVLVTIISPAKTAEPIEVPPTN